ncbi:MAG: lipoate--protein ligase family protein [archaeon]|nr:lipoate--protein ligase family protein [archaeon]
MKVKDYGIISPRDGLNLENTLFSKGEPSLIIYSRNRPTISLGRFNILEDCVDQSVMKKNHIAVIRRMSGGSAIYTDMTQLIYSIIIKKSHFESKENSYKMFCECLVKTLECVGIKSTYKPVNDVLVGDMKISGCSQYRDKNTVLHHGTLIMKLDADIIDRVLKPIKNERRSLTSIEECLGYLPDRREIVEAFEKSFNF